jgi:hypothetical protein
MTRDTVRRGLFGLLLLGVMLTLTGCRGTTWSKREEVRIGQQVAAEVEKAYKLDPDPAVQQRVQPSGSGWSPSRATRTSNTPSRCWTARRLTPSRCRADRFMCFAG